MIFSNRKEQLQQLLNAYPDLLSAYTVENSIVWLELKEDDRVTVDYRGGDRPWIISRPGNLYRNGKEFDVTKTHRYKNIDRAIKFLQEW